METVEQAKEFLRSNWTKGTDCPCCGQYVKLYKRKLNSGMAYGLIEAYKLSKTDWFHVNDLLDRKIAMAQLEVPRLKYWGLVEHKDNNDNPNTKTSGYWRVTQRGRDFVEANISVPKHVYVYNGKDRGFSDERTTINEALGNKFNYDELMLGNKINDEKFAKAFHVSFKD